MKVLMKHGFQREHGDEMNRFHTHYGVAFGLAEWGGLATALGVTTGGAVRRPTPTPAIPGMGGLRDAVVLEDIQGPLEIADGLSFSQGLFWALGLLALVGFLVWLWWRRRTPVGVEVKPADEVALERLRAAWPMMEHPKLFVGVVSDALRHYVENRFGLQAPERTTEEFLVELQNSRVLEESHKASLAGFLSHADLIKFAPHAPTQNELENLYNMATAWVVETMPLTDELNELNEPNKPDESDESDEAGQQGQQGADEVGWDQNSHDDRDTDAVKEEWTEDSPRDHTGIRIREMDIPKPMDSSLNQETEGGTPTDKDVRESDRGARL